MDAKSYDLHGVHVFECADAGPGLRTERDAVSIIEQALSHKSRFVIIPATRLDPDFFRLKTRVAGEFLQKFMNYGFRVAIVGDFSMSTAESESLRAFIYESNRGTELWLLPAIGDVEQRLAAGARL